MRRSIRTRLLSSFIGLTVIPLVLIGFIIGTQTFNTQTQQALTLQQQIAERESDGLSGYFQSLEKVLQDVAQQGGLLASTTREQQITLSSLLNQNSAFDKVFLLDDKGQEVAGVSRTFAIAPADFVSRAGTDEFIVPSTDRSVFYTPIHTDEFSGEPLITIGFPIENIRSGLVDGVLVADLRLLGAQNLVSGDVGNLQKGTDLYLVAPTNEVIAHNDPSIALRGVKFAPPAQDSVQTGLSGESAVLATSHFQLGDQTFTIVAETPTSEALNLAYNTVIFTAILVLLALIASVITALWIVNQIVKPISSLATTAHAIQSGDFSQRSQIVRQDEIGQFADAFNEMTDAIQKRETDLIKQAEDLRIATARAKEAARVKGEFLANVSHELRTPLNAIIGFSDMLMAGMSGPLNDKQVHKLERLKENGKRLLALINDLLDLTRIEAGRLEMVESPFSPRDMAERMTAQMESLAVESKLQFVTTISPDVPDMLSGDEKRIEQVVINLLSNAFKFTKEGSVTLNINTDSVEHTWNIEVTDTGIGIPPHAINVIFEEFRQVDGSYSRAYKGSGLGLSITRNLVRMMGGKIAVKSVLDRGSTFTVTLPLNLQTTVQSMALEALAN
ncbi:MAG: ATP-binding protein [Chloroflexota bacterium]